MHVLNPLGLQLAGLLTYPKRVSSSLPNYSKASSRHFAASGHTDVLKKGVTASGNVAESHCIPVLAEPAAPLMQAAVRNQLRLQRYNFFSI